MTKNDILSDKIIFVSTIEGCECQINQIPNPSPAIAAVAMWRNSRSFSAKLRSSSSSPNPSTSYRHIAVARPSLRVVYPYSSSLFSSVSSSPSSSDPIRLGFPNSDGFSSVADPSSLASASVVPRTREAVDLARHYGRCYWELSKARLRYFVLVQLNCV